MRVLTLPEAATAAPLACASPLTGGPCVLGSYPSVAGGFSGYIASCPPELKEAGIFHVTFTKFPGSRRMQRVAASLIAHKALLVPPAEPAPASSLRSSVADAGPMEAVGATLMRRVQRLSVRVDEHAHTAAEVVAVRLDELAQTGAAEAVARLSNEKKPGSEAEREGGGASRV